MNNSRLIFAMGLGCIVLGHLPLFILGEQSYLVVQDNIDSEYVYLHMLKMVGALGPWSGDQEVPFVMGGVPASYFHSPFSAVRIWFALLPSFWAYVVNSLVLRLLGWWGVWLLLCDDFKQPDRPGWLALLLGVTFVFLSFYPIFGLSTMGQPLLWWAFLRLQERTKLLASGLIVVLLPFYSHVVLVGPFFTGALILYALVQWWYKKPVSRHYVVGGVVLNLLYLAANYSLILGFLSGDVVSQREDWVAPLLPWSDVWNILVYGYQHAMNYQLLPLMALVAWAVWRQSERWRSMLLVLGLMLSVSFFYVASMVLARGLQEYTHFFTSFQLRRLAFLLPGLVLWLLLLCYQDKKLKTRIVAAGFVLFGAMSIIYNREIVYNWALWLLPESKTRQLVTYDGLHSEPLFQRIQVDLGRDPSTYYIVSVGIHPSVTQYHGFYTLDGYLNYYPLAYKRKFRTIIADELEKSPALKEHFDEWGSRFYIFSAETDMGCFVRNCYASDTIQHLAINTTILREMGGEYIFSAYVIGNAEELGLTLLKVYDDPTADYTVRVYQVADLPKSEAREESLTKE